MTPGYQAQSAQARKHEKNFLTDGQDVEAKSSWYGSHALLLGNPAKGPQKEFYDRCNHVVINMW
jgi:hypothetical protein